MSPLVPGNTRTALTGESTDQSMKLEPREKATGPEQWCREGATGSWQMAANSSKTEATLCSTTESPEQATNSILAGLSPCDAPHETEFQRIFVCTLFRCKSLDFASLQAQYVQTPTACEHAIPKTRPVRRRREAWPGTWRTRPKGRCV